MKFTIKQQLVSALLLIGIIPFAIISVISYINSKESLQEEAFSKLEAIQKIKKNQINDFVGEIISN